MEGQVPKSRQMKTNMSIHAVTTHGTGLANAVAQLTSLLQEHDSMDISMWLEDLVVVAVGYKSAIGYEFRIDCRNFETFVDRRLNWERPV